MYAELGMRSSMYIKAYRQGAAFLAEETKRVFLIQHPMVVHPLF